jgi:hypothetical protein
MTTTGRMVDPRAARERDAHPGELVRFSDSKTYFADPREDIRGRKVCDAAGHALGSVERLLLDNEHHHVRFLEVWTRTGFLGLHRHLTPIPVDAISRLEPDAVYLERTRQQVDAAPRIEQDPKTLTREVLASLFRHYGYTPYWKESYVAPLFHSHHHTPAHLNHHQHR